MIYKAPKSQKESGRPSYFERTYAKSVSYRENLGMGRILGLRQNSHDTDTYLLTIAKRS